MNVINFTLVTVLASVLCGRRVVVAIATISAIEMASIAWRRPLARAEQDLAEARFESIVQILPTYTVVAVVLWLSARQEPRC